MVKKFNNTAYKLRLYYYISIVIVVISYTLFLGSWWALQEGS
jgi:hypothetical protein